jgi:signal transduction histidine kinase
VATLRGYLETLLLKHDTLDEEERRRYLEIAHAQSERLGRLVEELFELARLDSGDIELECEAFSLSELVQDVASKFALRAEERGVELETRLSRDAPPVRGDLRLLERTLENLIENALRHTEAGGRVRVSVEPGEERVRVSVEDTGHGIPEDELPRIFDRFFQGQRDPGRADGGTGLGLAIARRVLELHDSRIEVSSREGEGSRFSFALAVV